MFIVVESTRQSASVSWLSLLRESEGQSLGAGIERLARLAATAHQQAQAERLAEGSGSTSAGEVER